MEKISEPVKPVKSAKIQCYKKVTLYLYDRKEINRMIIILLQDYLGRTVLDT
jgi:hypothetical protein